MASSSFRLRYIISDKELLYFTASLFFLKSFNFSAEPLNFGGLFCACALIVLQILLMLQALLLMLQTFQFTV